MDPYSTELLWMVIVGFILAFFLAFAIGANDVMAMANTLDHFMPTYQ